MNDCCKLFGIETRNHWFHSLTLEIFSFKPRFVEEIKNGNKKYEFRKSSFSQKYLNKIEKVFIYSSSPVQKVVARFFIGVILEDHPSVLWEKCKNYSGIERVEFFKYFGEKKRGLAIEISDIKFYKKPIEPKSIFPNFDAPQSFCYVDDIERFEKITNFF